MGREVINEHGKYAVRETVSDDEIITPWFETKAELVEHLVEHGDSWGSGPVKREDAEWFVEHEHVPSCIVVDGKMFATYQCATALR